MKTLDSRLLVCCALIIASPLAAGWALADDPASVPDRFSVQLEASLTPDDGATQVVASGGPRLRVGESGKGFLVGGRINDSGEASLDLCLGSVGGGTPRAAMLEDALHVWSAEVELLGATMENLTVRVVSSRKTATAPGEFETAVADARTITLREGERHTLDFLASDDPDGGCGRSLRVDLSASVDEDPRFKNARLSYDLWLVILSPDGQGVARQLALEGSHGSELTFSFPVQTWKLPGATFQDARPAETQVRVGGSLRGRLRADGSIDLLLEAERRLSVGPSKQDTEGGIADGGRKTLRIRPGETLSLPLPPAMGSHTVGLDGTWTTVYGAPGMTSAGDVLSLPEGGVEITDESVTVDFARFLEGHEMSLRLTVRDDLAHATSSE